MVNTDEIRIFNNLGLTYTQAKIYLHLNNVGKATAKKLSDISKIPRQDIYRILNELFCIGLVEKKITKPVEFKAISPEKCLKILINQRNQETKNIEKEAAPIISALNFAAKEKSVDESDLFLIGARSKQGIFLNLEKLLSELKESLFVLSPFENLFPWLFDQEKIFEKTLKRGVKIKVITSKTNDKALLKFFKEEQKNQSFEVRFVSNRPKISFGIYDNTKILCEMSVEEGYLKSQALITDNSCFLELFSHYFNSVWNEAEKQVVT